MSTEQKDFFQRIPMVDREVLMSQHRKNLETITDINRMTIDMLKNVMQLQTQYMHQAFEEIKAAGKDTMVAPFSQERLSAQAEKIKSSVTRAFEHGSSLSSVLMKGNSDIFHVVQDRLHENFDTIKGGSKYKL